MKSKLIINLCLAALALSNIVFFTSVGMAEPISPDDDPGGSVDEKNPDETGGGEDETLNSSVKCVNVKGTFKTIAEQEDNRAVLFIWKTKEFGSEYTPERRCQIVSTKFNSLVQSNNGSFNNLNLTTDVVNGYPVICTRKTDESSCNVLFTLKRENRGQAEKILNRLQDPNSLASGDSIIEAGRPVVDLGKWAKRKLRASQNSSSKIRPSQKPIKIKRKPSQGGGFK